MAKASNLFSEHLTEKDIAEMLAEAARVDALFQSGRIATTYLAPFENTLAAIAACSETATAVRTVPAPLSSDAAL